MDCAGRIQAEAIIEEETGRSKKVRRIYSVITCFLFLLLCHAVSADEFRPLPINLTGGAPVDEKFYSNTNNVELYEDPTIRVEYRRVPSKEWDCTYYYAIITLRDASQLRTASADNRFVSNATVPATTMAKRNNAVIAINGDYCAAFSGNKSQNYILRQGQVFRDTVEPDLDMLMIDEEGDFHVIPRETPMILMDKTMVGNRKVINAFQFGPAVVINGEKVDDSIILDYSRSPEYAKPDQLAQRMCIAQIDHLQYMVLCCARYGMTLPKFRDLAMSLAPCKTVYILDGGNSSQMVFMNKKKNKVIEGQQNVRPITDIIYFASAWFKN